MNTTLLLILVGILGFVLGVISMLVFINMRGFNFNKKTNSVAESTIKEETKIDQGPLFNVREGTYKTKLDETKEIKDLENRVLKIENDITRRNEMLKNRENVLSEKANNLVLKPKKIQEIEKEMVNEKKEQVDLAQQIFNLPKEKARELIFKYIEKTMGKEMVTYIKQRESGANLVTSHVVEKIVIQQPTPEPTPIPIVLIKQPIEYVISPKEKFKPQSIGIEGRKYSVPANKVVTRDNLSDRHQKSNGDKEIRFREAIAINRIIHDLMKQHQDRKTLSYLRDLQYKLVRGEICNVNLEALRLNKNMRLYANEFDREYHIQRSEYGQFKKTVKKKTKQLKKEGLVS